MKLWAFLLILTLSLSLCGCNQKWQKVTREIYALNTVITLTAYGDNADSAVEAGIREINRLENLFSVTKEQSDIWRINHADSQKVEVNSETASLLSKAISAHSLTKGKFDITIFEVSRLWGFTTGEYRVPESDEIKIALASPGIDKIELEGNFVTAKDGVTIDLGGIAKGYIGDRVAEVMKASGCSCGVISLGGNIRTLGKKPSEEPFLIGIEHPDKSGFFVTLSLGECSVITSGAYQRNFTDEKGNFYHHIIDPESGYPADSLFKSVTVIGNDGALCDALSTAIFIGGAEYAKEIYNSTNEFSFVLLTNDNTLLVSQDLRGKLKTEEGYEIKEIVYFGK